MERGDGGERKWYSGWKFSFNPQAYRNRLSPLGAAMLDTCMHSWMQKESVKMRLHSTSSNPHDNEYDGKCKLDYSMYDNAQHIPIRHSNEGISHPQTKITKKEVNDSNLISRVANIKNNDKKNYENANNSIRRMGEHLLMQSEMYEVNSIPPTLENLMLCPSKINIHHHDKEISSCSHLKSNDVDWEHMFDSQTLFTTQNNLESKNMTEKKVENPIEILNSEVFTKYKGSKVPKKDAQKSTFTIEISKKTEPKKKYKQKKITELVPKKKLKSLEKISNKSSANGYSRGLRKKPFPAAVKEWLESFSPENVVEESGHVMDTEPSLINKTSSSYSDIKTIQSRLVNRDGILKYSHTVDPHTFLISGNKQSKIETSSDFKRNSIESCKAMTKSTGCLNSKKKISTQTETGLMVVEKQKSEKDSSALKTPPNVKKENGTKDIVGDDKLKNQKPKFIPSIKSQLPLKDIVYHIVHMDKETIYRNFDDRKDNDAITLTLIYENDFCQLNCQYTQEDCVSKGILIAFNNEFFYLSQTKIIKYKNIREMFENVVMSNHYKICYDAKAIIIFTANCLRMNANDISSRFLDVKVAAFLMDPDKPPQSFSDVQNAINYVPEFTISTECHLQKTAWYMNLLNDCMVQMKSILEEKSLWKIFTGMEMELLPILAGLELRGLKVDTVRFDKMKEIILEKMKTVEQECYKSARKVFQINSPLQLRSIIYDDLKLDSKLNIKIKETSCSGFKSTSEAMLKSLAESHPLPKLVLEYRHLHKALATFITGIAHHVRDGVVRGNWLQTAAATGRIACNNPNLQAIPKMPFQISLYPLDNNSVQPTLQLRSAYVARAGYALLAADFQQVECRVFAHLAQDGTLLGALAAGGDLFVALAQKWLNKQPGEVSQEDRDRTKRMVYASMYGAGTKKLMDILNMSYDQTLTVVSSFNRTFPSLKSFGQRVVERCRLGDGTLETLCGRRRTFHNIFSDNFTLRAQAERQAVNFIIQGSAADLCKAAMISTERSLRASAPRADCHLVLQIHDELVWEAANRDLSTLRDVVKNAMESCGIACGMDIKLPVAVSAGANWADMHLC